VNAEKPNPPATDPTNCEDRACCGGEPAACCDTTACCEPAAKAGCCGSDPKPTACGCQ
jgi:hypothetical protein